MRIKEYYRNYAYEESNWWFLGMKSIYFSLLNLHINPSSTMKILDVGCGTGGILDKLSHYGFVIGGDISKEALRFCQTREQKNLIMIDSVYLPFKTNSFDVITAFGVIEHIEDDLGMLKELYRVSKPGGNIVFLTSAYQFLWSYHDVANEHKRRYNKIEFKQRLFGSGFTIRQISYVNFLLFPFIAVIRVMQKLTFRNKMQAVQRDIFNPPSFINNFLIYLLKFEGFCLKRKINFPFGVSIICVAEK